MSAEVVAPGRSHRRVRRAGVCLALAVVTTAIFGVSLMVGNTFYPLIDVVRVVGGEEVPGASFTVGQLRLPRATLALVAGASFGAAGVTFQTMLRNPWLRLTSSGSAPAPAPQRCSGWWS